MNRQKLGEYQHHERQVFLKANRSGIRIQFTTIWQCNLIPELRASPEFGGFDRFRKDVSPLLLGSTQCFKNSDIDG
jgi:hypothetical protein